MLSYLHFNFQNEKFNFNNYNKLSIRTIVYDFLFFTTVLLFVYLYMRIYIHIARLYACTYIFL